MPPVIALVGRPNVGKSTLFNQLTRSRDALVANLSGLTRDRKYGDGKLGDIPYIVIDTGGISGNEFGIDAVLIFCILQRLFHEEQHAFDQPVLRHQRSYGQHVHHSLSHLPGF